MSSPTKFPGNNRIYPLTLSAILATLALAFTYVEFLIPYSLGIPGIKLGLANIVIVIALYNLNGKYALTINLLRIALSGLLFSGLFGGLYSLGGGIVSLAIMIILRRSNFFSMIGVSMAGGVFHNLGQLLFAAFLISDIRVFLYFPLLLFTGIVSGIAMGVVAYILNGKLPSFLFSGYGKR